MESEIVSKGIREFSPLVFEWQPKFGYAGEERVAWQGRIYRAKWWTQGEEPGGVGDEIAWCDEGPCDV